jgi:hypothetical protein
MSGQAKFSPGPREVRHDHPQNACVHVVSVSSGCFITSLYGDSEYNEPDDYGIFGPAPVRDADAALIAAAPEMYEALQEIEWIFDGKEDITDDGGPNDAMRALMAVRRVLAKAEGRA